MKESEGGGFAGGCCCSELAAAHCCGVKATPLLQLLLMMEWNSHQPEQFALYDGGVPFQSATSAQNVHGHAYPAWKLKPHAVRLARNPPHRCHFHLCLSRTANLLHRHYPEGRPGAHSVVKFSPKILGATEKNASWGGKSWGCCHQGRRLPHATRKRVGPWPVKPWKIQRQAPLLRHHRFWARCSTAVVVLPSPRQSWDGAAEHSSFYWTRRRKTLYHVQCCFAFSRRLPRQRARHL
mmetsp:Transcript_51849/g.131067  ORF Transcript_51849/g.131067 Transcript_51849/m.131067 type:complete len:237 (-) Transcript_51849:1326-2036(-)